MYTFETKLTVRIHDIKLAEKLNELYRRNPNRYQTKNQLIVELIELGANEKLKELAPLSVSKGAQPRNLSLPSEGGNSLQQIKELLEGMHLNNQKQIEGLIAHLKMSERLSSAIYNILLAVATDEPVTKIQVEFGFLDNVPERFEEFLNELLQKAFEDETGGGKGGEYKN